MRRKSFAKNSADASTNSPRDWLNTPLPLVSSAGLSTSSGNSSPSSPAARECTAFGRDPGLNSCDATSQLLEMRFLLTPQSPQRPETIFESLLLPLEIVEFSLGLSLFCRESQPRLENIEVRL